MIVNNILLQNLTPDDIFAQTFMKKYKEIACVVYLFKAAVFILLIFLNLNISRFRDD